LVQIRLKIRKGLESMEVMHVKVLRGVDVS
jgi:hypothetical protein